MKNVHRFFDNGIAPASLIDFPRSNRFMTRFQVLEDPQNQLSTIGGNQNALWTRPL